MFSYRYEGDKVHLEAHAVDKVGQVLIGVRPCDAVGMSRLDDVFLGDDGEVNDSFHAERRDRTTVLSLGCYSAAPGCF